MPLSPRSAAVLALSLVALVGCRGPAPRVDDLPFDDTAWTIFEIEGQGVLVDRPPTLRFDRRDKRVIGFAGVNRLVGAYARDGESLRIENVVTTRMAGPPPQMQTEDSFLRALRTVTSYRIEESTLLLLADDRVVVRARVAATTPAG